MKTILKTLVCFCAFLLGCAVASADIEPQVMKRVKAATPCIVVVEFHSLIEYTLGKDGGDGQRVLRGPEFFGVACGTGVLVGKDGQYGHVVTDSNLLPVVGTALSDGESNGESNGESSIVVEVVSGYAAFAVFPQPNGVPRIYPVQEGALRSNPKSQGMSEDSFANGVAVLRIASKDLPEPLSFADKTLAEADTVYAVGYPAVLDKPQDGFALQTALMRASRLENGAGNGVYFTVGDLSDMEQFLNVCVSRGSVSRVVDQPGAMGKVYHTATISSGNSGGPLVNEKGHIVGINTWSRNDPGFWFVSLSASTAIDMLKTNGVPYHLASKEKPQSAARAPESKKRR